MLGVILQDAQTEEVQTYFCQFGPVNSCQLVHNDSALIGLISQQAKAEVCFLSCFSASQSRPVSFSLTSLQAKAEVCTCFTCLPAACLCCIKLSLKCKHCTASTAINWSISQQAEAVVCSCSPCLSTTSIYCIKLQSYAQAMHSQLTARMAC